MEKNLQDLFGVIIDLKNNNLEDWWAINFRKIDADIKEATSNGIMFRCVDGSVHVIHRSIGERSTEIDEIAVFEITTIEDMVSKFRELCDEHLYMNTRLNLDNRDFKNLLLEIEKLKLKYAELSKYKNVESYNIVVEKARQILNVTENYLSR